MVVAVSVVHVRCLTSSARIAERTPKFLSSHEEIDLFTAEIAFQSMLQHVQHVVISEDKKQTSPLRGFLFCDIRGLVRYQQSFFFVSTR